MSVDHIKPLLLERAAAANASRPPASGAAFATVAAKVCPDGAPAKIAAKPTAPDVPAAVASPDVPAAVASADGLAAMRLALARMGAGSSQAAAARQGAASSTKVVVDVGSKAAGSDAGGAARLPPLTGRDLQDMLKLQTGSFDPALYARLGAHYNDYVNAYGAGGYYYDPTAVTLAAMSDADVEKLKTEFASPQAWLEKHGWYANAVAAAPSSWDALTRARMA
jgi:hypothetical protein